MTESDGEVSEEDEHNQSKASNKTRGNQILNDNDEDNDGKEIMVVSNKSNNDDFKRIKAEKQNQYQAITRESLIIEVVQLRKENRILLKQLKEYGNRENDIITKEYE